MPEHDGVLAPILHVVPLQLLAEPRSGGRSRKPRNPAKSVTVE